MKRDAGRPAPLGRSVGNGPHSPRAARRRGSGAALQDESLSTRLSPSVALAACFLLTAVIAALDAFVAPSVSLGLLYVVPVVLSAAFLPRWGVVLLAVVCTILREQFGPNAWQHDAPMRLAMGLVAFPAAGMFVHEIVGRRQFEAATLERLKQETALRQEAEEEAHALIESSPAAILTVNADGMIDLSNAAAKQLLGFGSESMAGQSISDFFPGLANMIKAKRVSLLRTMVESSGRRRNGDMFFAHMWISSYRTAAGVKLTAVIADASEQLRDREELGLRQLLTSSRIVAGAVSHEIRNLAAAARVLHESIGQSGTVAETEDFAALGQLIDAMRKLSSSETSASVDEVLTGVDLNSLLKELNIILRASDNDSDIELRWEVTEQLPRVHADHSGLLQVFLNLAQNSRRALVQMNGSVMAHGVGPAASLTASAGTSDSGSMRLTHQANGPTLRGSGARPYIAVTAYQLGSSVVVRFSDNGPGIAAPETLFQPFKTGAASAGLGLYVSRALIRTYGGELQYMRRASESCFVIELPALASLEEANA